MFCYLHPCFFRAFGWSVDGAAQNIISVTSHPCRIQVWAIGALVMKRVFVRMELSSSVQIDLVVLIRVFTQTELSSRVRVDLVVLIEIHRTRGL